MWEGGEEDDESMCFFPFLCLFLPHETFPTASHRATSSRRERKNCFKFLIFHLIFLFIFALLSAGRYIFGLKRWIVESRRGIGGRRHAEASEQSRGPPADDTAAQGEHLMHILVDLYENLIFLFFFDTI